MVLATTVASGVRSLSPSIAKSKSNQDVVLLGADKILPVCQHLKAASNAK